MIRDVPAVRLRQAQVPIAKTVQKMVEAPQELLVDHEVDVPVGCDVRFRRSRKRTEQTRLHRCCAMIRPEMFQKRRRSGCSTRTEKVPNSLSNSRKERFSSSTNKGKPLTVKGIKAEDLKEADDETIQLMKTSST